MRDVLEKIIATEGEAKSIVDKARTEAESILSEGRANGHKILEQARHESFMEVNKIIEVAIKSAEEEKDRLLAEAILDIEKNIRLEDSSKRKFAEEVARCVCDQA